MLICAGCGTRVEVGPDRPWAFRCPEAGDDRDHVLLPVVEREGFPEAAGEHPFLDYRSLLHSHALALREGLGDARFVGLVAELDGRIAEVEAEGGSGHGVIPARFREAPALAAATGTDAWLEDETDQAGGSHKIRHLVGIALHLAVVEALGWVDAVPPLAIASCGNAALAAAVVARAARRDLRVFVPEGADEAVLERLRALGATVEVCVREGPGDPSVRRCEQVVAAGALPFTVQGPANGLALEGGQTLGWEMGTVLAGEPLDHLVIQVGGGALASSVLHAFEQLVAWGVVPRLPVLHTVQTEGAWPLKRAWQRVAERAEQVGVEPALAHAAAHRSAYMTPWETAPRSLAHGILDDETWDWHHVVAGMLRTGGRPVVASEALLEEAWRLVVDGEDLPASPTGAAGVAGLLALTRDGTIGPAHRAAVLITGRSRPGAPHA